MCNNLDESPENCSEKSQSYMNGKQNNCYEIPGCWQIGNEVLESTKKQNWRFFVIWQCSICGLPQLQLSCWLFYRVNLQSVATGGNWEKCTCNPFLLSYICMWSYNYLKVISLIKDVYFKLLRVIFFKLSKITKP